MHHLLHDQGLGTFYTLKGEDCVIRPLDSDWEIHPEDQALNGQASRYLKADAEGYTARFYIEGVQCGACVWLLDQLHNLTPQIIRSKLDFGHSILTLKCDTSVNLSQIASLIRTLGYTPTPLLPTQGGTDHWKKERRMLLTQIGVSAFISANIMIFSVSVYGGASGIEKTIFEWLSFLLCLPIVTWMAIPFYKRALSGLLTRELNIDLSVSIAVLGGFLLSTWNLLHHSSHLYFDSVSAFCFLLISTRFLLKSIYHRLSQTTQSTAFGLPDSALMLAPEPRYIPLQDIPIGSVIQIEKNSIIPIDGTLLSPEAYLDTHLLTGESWPEKVLNGASVYAFSATLSDTILIRTTSLSSESRMQDIFTHLHDSKPTQLTQLTDRVAKWFVLWVLILAGSVGIYQALFYQQGFTYVLALIMVSCPCALALTTPLIYTLGLQKAAHLGIFVKDAGVFDAILTCRSVFLDKTGTLTQGQLSVISVSDTPELTAYLGLILSLESESRHPIAKALVRYIEAQHISALPVDDIQEVFGKGVLGHVGQDTYFIGKTDAQTGALPDTYDVTTQVGFYKNDDLIMTITLGDCIKADIPAFISGLKMEHKTPILLSGDHPKPVVTLATQLGISDHYAQCSPEEKYRIIRDHQPAIMVGDGVNDALALAHSAVGISVSGSLLESLKTSSVYLATPQLSRILSLFKISSQVKQTIWITLTVSTLYNFVGITLVLLGKISPLVAAILMPTSSLTVTLVALLGLRRKVNPL